MAQASKTKPNLKTADKAPEKAQAAWLRVVDKIERGELKDPNGQYVSKVTQVAPGTQQERPKFDASLANYPKWYEEQIAKELAAASTKTTPSGGVMSNYVAPCDPCEGGGGVAPPTSTFTSSVGQGGSGAILDLKVMYNNEPSSSAVNLNRAGYIKLNSDLNKGAGGDYIYFTFTRDPTRLLYGPGDFRNSNIFAFATKTQARFSISSTPAPPDYFVNIWTLQYPNAPEYLNADLNGRAGGKYIYSYQSKDNFVSTTRFTEVGVLSGNSGSITPPAEWTKYPQDLNEGCGGDYIYFCYR